MAKVVRCRVCQVELATGLEPLEDKNRLEEGDKQPHVPRGRLVLCDGGFWPGTEGTWMVHLADVDNTRQHPDPRRCNGCCGLDGGDGLNTVCSNGHEVGTEKSDCWMPHAMLFDPQKVVIGNGREGG